MRIRDAAPPFRGPVGGRFERARGVERSLPAQFVMFCVVGLGNAVVDATVYAALVGLVGWTGTLEATAASAAGFLAGATHSFFWNSRVTFRGRYRRPESASTLAGRFLVVAVGGVMLAALVSALVLTLWPPGFRLVAAKLAALGAAALWNFSLARAWVFRRHAA